jgi:hypothetical protein
MRGEWMRGGGWRGEISVFYIWGEKKGRRYIFKSNLMRIIN